MSRGRRVRLRYLDYLDGTALGDFHGLEGYGVWLDFLTIFGRMTKGKDEFRRMKAESKEAAGERQQLGRKNVIVIVEHTFKF